MAALLLPAILLGWLVYVVLYAPEGYEDEGGFHAGHPFIGLKRGTERTRRALARTRDSDDA